MRLRKAVLPAACMALAPLTAFAVYSAAPAAHAAPQACTRTVHYLGTPAINNGVWVEQIFVDTDSCNNKLKAAAECLIQNSDQWAYGNVVQGTAVISTATCPSSAWGVGSYGFQWLNGTHWVYTGH